MSAVLSRLTLSLFATALALRLLIAPGMMPVASTHGVTMADCPGQMQHGRGEPVTPGCPFAAIAAPAVAPVAPMLALAPLGPAAPTVAMPAPAERAHGPPADRPPSTGPPLLA